MQEHNKYWFNLCNILDIQNNIVTSSRFGHHLGIQMRDSNTRNKNFDWFTVPHIGRH